MAHGALVVHYATKSQNKHPEDMTSSAGSIPVRQPIKNGRILRPVHHECTTPVMTET